MILSGDPLVRGLGFEYALKALFSETRWLGGVSRSYIDPASVMLLSNESFSFGGELERGASSDSVSPISDDVRLDRCAGGDSILVVSSDSLRTLSNLATPLEYPNSPSL